MSLPARRSNDVLGIELDTGDEAIFGPGDTVSGRVYRRAALLTPDATVRVSLRGRTSSKINLSVHREQLPIIDHKAHSAVLYIGPLHIKNATGRVEWPFSLTLPTHVEPGIFSATEGGVLRPESYLGKDSILPPSCSGMYETNDYKQFIEYFVQADLESHRSNHDEAYVARVPFYLQSYTRNDPIDDFSLQRLSFNRMAASHKLSPDNDKSSRSRTIGKLIGSVSKPTFCFRLNVDCPTVLQVDSPVPIPLLISAEPRWEMTTEALRGIQQVIQVVGIEFSLRRTIDVKKDNFMQITEESQSHRIERPFQKATQQLKQPLVVPWGDESEPLDIGAVVGLQLDSRGSASERRSLAHSRSICDFEVGFTKVMHYLGWVITLDIAGEKVIVRQHIEPRVVVLPPSECTRKWYGKSTNKGAPPAMESSAAWIRPPEEPDAPPTFEDVQREDEKAGRNDTTRVENGESSSSAQVDGDR